MKIKELNNSREKSVSELEKLLNKKSIELMQVKVRAKVKKEKNLKHAKILKKDISQIKTILREKKLTEENDRGSEEKVK